MPRELNCNRRSPKIPKRARPKAIPELPSAINGYQERFQVWSRRAVLEIDDASTLFNREMIYNENVLSSTSRIEISSSEPVVQMLVLKPELPALFEESASFPTFPRRSDFRRKRTVGRCPNRTSQRG